METNRVSLRMAEPADVAGAWEVVIGTRTCPMTLRTERVETANAYVLNGGACLDGAVPATAVAWRPAPEGIELVGADRLTLVLFTDDGRGGGTAVVGTAPATLRRRPPGR